VRWRFSAFSSTSRPARRESVSEPKTGVKPPPAAVGTFDTPGTQGYGPFSRVDYSEVDNIVVYLEGMTSATTPTQAPSAFTITVDPGKSSHGIDGVVSVGQKVVLRNGGSKAQSIYSVSDGNDFEISAVPVSGSGEYSVRSAGLIEIFADSSKDIAIQLFAAPTSWVQLGRAGQTLNFNNIPPGRYHLVSWHARLPGTSEEIELTADHVADATITVGVNSLPKVTADAAR
jgi:hypothetical protein